MRVFLSLFYSPWECDGTRPQGSASLSKLRGESGRLSKVDTNVKSTLVLKDYVSKGLYRQRGNKKCKVSSF